MAQWAKPGRHALSQDPATTALFRAVLDAPGDDRPRLVYADQLDQLGQHTHAEFIRVQCELARTPATSELAEVVARRAVLRGRGVELFPLLPTSLKSPVIDGETLALFETPDTWARGFPTIARLEGLADWLHFGPCLVRILPLDRVELGDRVTFWGRYGFRWTRCPSSEPLAGPYELPAQIFDCLPRLQTGSATDVIHFDSDRAAHDALSAALLLWARAQPMA